MKREQFLKERNTIFLNIASIQSNLDDKGRLSPVQKKALEMLSREKNTLYSEFESEHAPCNVGDTFTTESAGGRKIRGVAVDFFIRDGHVYVESYYPIVNGNKKSQIAYLSVPHKELKVIV